MNRAVWNWTGLALSTTTLAALALLGGDRGAGLSEGGAAAGTAADPLAARLSAVLDAGPRRPPAAEQREPVAEQGETAGSVAMAARVALSATAPDSPARIAAAREGWVAASGSYDASGRFAPPAAGE